MVIKAADERTNELELASDNASVMRYLHFTYYSFPSSFVTKPNDFEMLSPLDVFE